MRFIGPLLRLGPGGWIDLLRAQWAVLRWTFIKRFRATGRLIGSARGASVGGDAGHAAPSDEESLRRARELATAVDRVSRLGVVRARCLVRSLALQELLEREGIRGHNVRFGARTRAGEFQAHAWVELRGQVIGDDEAHVRTFSPFQEVRRLTDWERFQ